MGGSSFNLFHFHSQLEPSKRGVKLICLISDLSGISVSATTNKALTLKYVTFANNTFHGQKND